MNNPMTYIRILSQMKECKTTLCELQSQNGTRERAIALTHLETAILWLQKEYVEFTAEIVDDHFRNQTTNTSNNLTEKLP